MAQAIREAPRPSICERAKTKTFTPALVPGPEEHKRRERIWVRREQAVHAKPKRRTLGDSEVKEFVRLFQPRQRVRGGMVVSPEISPGKTSREYRGVEPDKLCTVCKQAKPVSEFGQDTRKHDGRKSVCRECERKSRRRGRDNRDYDFHMPPEVARFIERETNRRTNRYREEMRDYAEERVWAKQGTEDEKMREARRAIDTFLKRKQRARQSGDVDMMDVAFLYSAHGDGLASLERTEIGKQTGKKPFRKPQS